MLHRALMALAIAIFGVLYPAAAGAGVDVRLTLPRVHVRTAPPAVREEIRTEQPSPRHTWVEGYWAWRDARQVWIAGHWAVPPHEGMVWERARWERSRNGYDFTEGNWRWEREPAATEVYEPAAEPTEIAVERRPPREIVEVLPARPFPHAVWVKGYWHWTGSSYVWVSGRWSAARPGYVWRQPHWAHHGHRYEFYAGAWRRVR